MKIQIKDLHGHELETIKEPTLNPGNRNILICGSSGTGKTTLLRKIEETFQPTTKILFKSDKEESIKVKEHRPFFTEDRINFLDSWQEAHQVDIMGYMILQEQIILENAKESNQTLSELKNTLRKEETKRQDLEKIIVKTIESKLKTLYPAAPEKTFNFRKINMEGLTEEEYQFFSSYILRNKYEKLLDEHISIDEIHRLKPLMPKLLTRITREIRSRGGLLATTQSLSDLPPEMTNNFSTIFLFETLDNRDLQFLDLIEPKLKETALELENHEFIEIRSFNKLKRKGQTYKMELTK